MKKNLPSILAGAALLVIMILYMCTFQVRFTEVAIRKTFGKANRTILNEPQLYFKWPWPIQSVVKFDKRIRILEDRTEETLTADDKNIIITTFTGWTIEDPYKFHTAFPDEARGEKVLRTVIRSHKKAVVGSYGFAQFVSTDPSERRLPDIEQEMKGLVRADVEDKYGVSIQTFGIKRLSLPETVTQSVFESMKKHQQNKADNYKAEGEARAREIVSKAQATRDRIMAVARRRADEIRSQAQREVGEIYKAFAGHEDLRIFLDKLQTLERVMRNRTTVIFNTVDVPFDLFDERQRDRVAEEIGPLAGQTRALESDNPRRTDRPSSGDGEPAPRTGTVP